MKNIIITGGKGFIGGHLVALALKKKFNVLNLDKISYSSTSLNSNYKSNNYKFIKCDISKRKLVSNIILEFKPDYIINCAAESHVDRSIENPEIFYKSNILGVLNILDTIVKNKLDVRFHQISTDEVYGSLNLNDKKFNENTPYNPSSPYSSSKASADHIISSYGSTYDLNYVITNCSNNFGPNQYPEKLIPLTILNCISKKNINVYGRGANIRDWLYVQDHCEAIFKVLLKAKSKSKYLIGGNSEISNLDIVKLICEISKKKLDKNFDYLNLIKHITDRPGHDFRYAINFNKIKKDLNWSPRFDFSKGMEMTYMHYLKNFSYYLDLYKKDKWLTKKYKKIN